MEYFLITKVQEEVCQGQAKSGCRPICAKVPVTRLCQGEGRLSATSLHLVAVGPCSRMTGLQLLPDSVSFAKRVAQSGDDGCNFFLCQMVENAFARTPGLHDALGPKPHQLLRHGDRTCAKCLGQLRDVKVAFDKQAKDLKPPFMRQRL